MVYPSMQPLDWPDIYRVSEKRRLPTQEEIDKLRQACGVFPPGYEEFINEFGFGELDSILLIKPEDEFGQTAFLRKCFSEMSCMLEEFDESIGIPEQAIDDGVALAGTDWGYYYFCSPSDPGVLWYIDWECGPDILPLGFRNPYVHQKPNRQPEVYGDEDLVFDAYRDLFRKYAYLSGLQLTPNDPSTLATLVRDVLNCIQPNKIIEHEEAEMTSAYLKRWGVEVTVGFRHQDKKFFFFAKGDAEREREFLNCIAKLEDDGYVFEESD